MPPTTVRVPFTPPLDADALWDYLAARIIGGIEEIDAHTYRRTLSLRHGPGVIAIARPRAGESSLAVAVTAAPADLQAAADAAGRIADVGADPAVILAGLGEHPWLGPLVRERPGVRAPGQAGGFEVAVRAVLGQQVSLAAAGTHTSRLARAIGTPLAEPDGALTHLFPTAAQLARVDPDDGGTLAMPAGRRRALIALARAADDGLDLDGGLDPDEAERRLLALPGIGPWTTQYVRMRALGDPDAYCGTDLVLRRAAERLAGGPVDPAGAAFAPWRTYAAHHLWRQAHLEAA
ncbi:DNA-3-methyladenine glycosylase 2 family protein [Occultella glacieicola]|uniref:DNA-3-methyladenine glycosylase II n=1 Tax=Occultella glacieicola TaxID=2518684 RepID=A0ABY2E897_9MICO|nr:AlkA N-terminal domain-containing protein [Occultella glacieicola]TDE97212.1 DNA-3-methyladenine glycosylase 2 family protein [Occultella glacieicola]